MYSSGEESPIKTRKPYTITKQRERWSDEEHNRFLEALKLHGRAWQRIEEHIGTKTAVQIRSHAQKFFTKLEKEALIKGVPLKETIDIDIPPPRPKKKPSNPYPRKTSAGTSSSSPEESRNGKLLKLDSSLHSGKQILDLETEPPLEKPDRTEKSTRAKEALDETDRSEVLTLFQEVPCTSISSVRKCSSPPIGFGKTRAFREFISSTKEGSNHGASDDYGSFLTLDLNANQKIDRNKENNANLDYSMSEVSNQDNCCHSSHELLVNGEKTDGVQNQPEKLVRLTTDKIAADQDSTRNLPVHVVDVSSGINPESKINQQGAADQDSTRNLPVHVVDVSSGINPESKINQQGAADGCSNLFTKPTSTASPQQYSNIPGTAIHQLLPGFIPSLTSICNNQDSSQMFSSLIMSALLQNPAAHAAATLAASLWPITNLNTSVGFPAGSTHPSSYMSPPQNMAAMAAATVAAASAWWAAHGFFPMCPSLHAGFTSVPVSSTAVPAETGQAPLVNKEVEETISKNPPQENPLSESPEIQGLDSKGSPPSSSDSEESGDPSLEINLVESADQPQEPLPETAVNDSNKGKAREQVYRSSCGSNTASSSEVEATALEKQEETKEESTKPDDNYPPSFDLNNHRTRFTGSNINESWKEVSSEGRMAFQALFSRERLPQSFLSQRDPGNTGELMNNENEVGSQEPYMKDGEIKPQLDLFGAKLWMDSSSTPFNHGGMEKHDLLFNSCNMVKGFSPMRMGVAHGKLRGYRTGFKPYKRCSAEEGRVTAAEGKSAKRIRLEEETAASTR